MLRRSRAMPKEKALYEDNRPIVFVLGAAVILGVALLILAGAWLTSKQWPTMPNPDVEVQRKHLQGFGGIRVPYTTFIDRKTGQRSPVLAKTL
jgi:hypothetical protein